MSLESTVHDSVHAFADGELPSEEAESFRLHLGTCAQCQAELADLLMMQDLGSRLAAEEAPPVPVPVPVPHPAREVPSRAFRPAWSRRRTALGAALGGALAAAFALAVLRAPSGPEPTEVLALAPTRSLEARLSHAGASGWRPYDVKRSGGERPMEKVPLKARVRLEEAGDTHGLAVAALLSGEREQAGEYLKGLGASPEVDSDRAALALSRGELEEALGLLEEVLKRAPSHPQALWNRGLVLRELGLEALAARSFAQVAALGEPGWSDEARERQQALEARGEARRQQAEALRQALGALVSDGTALPEALVRQAPSQARGALYLAVAAAPSVERVQALRPLAQALDAHFGGDGLRRYVERVARDYGRRGSLAARFAKLGSAALPAAEAEAEAEDLVRGAQASGEEDWVVVALARTELGLERAEEYAAAATALGDGWFILDAKLAQARALMKADERSGAEATLREVLSACESQRLEGHCARAEELLAEVYAAEGRWEEARTHAQGALARARQQGDSAEEARLLRQLAEVMRGSGSLALASAWRQEAALRQPAP